MQWPNQVYEKGKKIYILFEFFKNNEHHKIANIILTKKTPKIDFVLIVFHQFSPKILVFFRPS